MLFLLQKTNVGFAFEKCSSCSYDLLAESDVLKTQLKRQLNAMLKRYAEAAYVCEDATCNHRQRDSLELTWTSSYGPTCSMCQTAFMIKEVSFKSLYSTGARYFSVSATRPLLSAALLSSHL